MGPIGPSGLVAAVLPTQLQGPPTQLQSTPTQLQGPPSQLQSTPTQLQSAPTQLQSTPTQLQGPPTQCTPTQLQVPPAQLQGPPTQLQGAPTQLQGPLTQLQGPPTQLQGPPTQLQGTSTQLQGTPTQLQVPPTQLLGQPTQLQGLPVQVLGSPIQLQGPPTQLQGHPLLPLTPPLATTSSSSSLTLNRLSLPDPLRRFLNVKSAALLNGQKTAKAGGQAETGVLDEARKQLLAKNNVSIFQKSKAGGAARKELAAGHEGRMKEGVKAAHNLAAAQGMPVKVPRPPEPQLRCSVGSLVEQHQSKPCDSLAQTASRPVYTMSRQPVPVSERSSAGKLNRLPPPASGIPLSGKGANKGRSEEAKNEPDRSPADRIAATSGHPGLPSGLMRMASSVIPASNSPTKITPRTEAKHVTVATHSESVEVRRARLDLLFQAPVPALLPAPAAAYEDPPVLTPQVSWSYDNELPAPYSLPSIIYLVITLRPIIYVPVENFP